MISQRADNIPPHAKLTNFAETLQEIETLTQQLRALPTISQRRRETQKRQSQRSAGGFQMVEINPTWSRAKQRRAQTQNGIVAKNIAATQNGQE